MLVAGCQEQAASSTRRVVAHRLPACDVEGSKMLLTALGDFDSPRTESVDLKGSSEVALPPELHGVEASTSQAGKRCGTIRRSLGAVASWHPAMSMQAATSRQAENVNA